MLNHQFGTYSILFCPNVEQANQINQSWVGCSRISNPLRSSGFAAVIYSKGLTNIFFVSFCPQWKPGRETKTSKSLNDEFVVTGVKYVVSVYLLRFCVAFEPWQIRVVFPTHQAFCQGCLPDASPRACNRCRETWAEPWDDGRRRCSLVHFEECVEWQVFVLWFCYEAITWVIWIILNMYCICCLCWHSTVLFYVCFLKLHTCFSWSLHLYTYMFSVVFIDSHDCSPVLNDQWSLFWIGVSEHMKRAFLLNIWWWFNKLSYCKWLSCSWNES